MWVQVTQQDISNSLTLTSKTGKRADHYRNPIALALHRVDPCAMVTQKMAHLVQGVCILPYHAQCFIERWNKSGAVQPFEFSL